MADELLKYKIGIGLIPKIGPVLTRRLIAYCGSAEAVFREKRTNLEKIPGIGDKLADYVFKNDVLNKAEEEISFIEKNKVKAVFYLDNDYPERLRHCEDAPVIIFIKGITDFKRPKVLSVVGTRNPTDYGKELCRQLIEDLAAVHPDLLIVSGLAYGIDICAHRSAIKNKLDTAAVLAHGFTVIYPAVHRETARQIIDHGALLTEFLHHEQPEPNNFVKRNRIIAGIADATLVVESGRQGGAMITADIANSYSRDVFAFPGRVFDNYSAGCNRLIKTNRAALVEDAHDIEYLMGWQKDDPKNRKELQKELFVDLSDDESSLLTAIREKSGLTIDQISLHCEMPVSKASALLLNLEFHGLVKCLPGKLYKPV
ncbi:MAG: DNA-processing protein DprA [Bacteroidales bacterium]|nr:DNA-processing protein DprA [Bacteroidales bacterium]MBN2762960.1 DNA-processing protein DprA [Bacteroidales bacterium]